MKRNLLTITLFSILAILPSAIFAQSSDALYKQMNAEFDAQKFPEVIETATKFLSLPVKKPIDRVIAFNMRASSIEFVYFDNSKPNNSDYTLRYSPKTVEMLRLAISDNGEVINYYRNLKSRTAEDEDFLSGTYSDSAKVYLSLGQYSSHNPADFAKAEELYKLALPKSKKQQWLNMKLVLCLAGQYKFYEARDLANRVLAAETEEDYIVTLSFITEAFDSMGEYQFADAFLLEQAGIRKVANKSLTEMLVVKARREDAQKASLGFANPMTAMELNRKGALLSITQQCDKALPLLEKSMAISEYPTAARYAIPCLFNQKNYEVAWQTSNGLVNLNKDDVVALSFRGVLYGMQNDAAKAEADLAKAISVFPELAAIFNSLDNAKKIYQVQNKPNKVNEIEALEKKLAALNAEMNPSSILGDLGIQTILDEDEEDEEESANEAKNTKQNEKPDTTKSSINSTTPKPTAPTKTLAELNCNKIETHEGCGKLKLFMTESELLSMLGNPEKKEINDNADQTFFYYSKGLSFSINSNGKIREISFNGWTGWKLDSKYITFQGTPEKNISWKMSLPQVRKIYGRPLEQTTKTDEEGKYQNLMYGRIEFRFRDGKLAAISVY